MPEMTQPRLNIIEACRRTLQWADRRHVPQDVPGFTPRHRLQRIVVMTVLTESAGHMYANANIPASLKLPHDAIGNDHHSVGLFQQQVGADGSNQFGWGNVAECMDIGHSTNAFLHGLQMRDLADWRGPELWVRCQAVQISAFADGSNYRQNYMSAKHFIDNRDNRRAIHAD